MPATSTPDKPKRTRKPRASRTAPSTTLEHVHETPEAVSSVELSPPHPPREETPEYAAAHHFLVYEKKAPCEVCGVTVDTLATPASNPFGAKAVETHHYPIERSLADACDPVKVHRDFPSVYNRATLLQFVDSPGNLKVLCDQHHRSLAHGIHHLLPADWAVQKYLYSGYIVAAAAKDAATAEATDEHIEQAEGVEQAVDAQMDAPAPAPAKSAPKSRRVRKPIAA